MVDFSEEILIVEDKNITLCFINDFSDNLKNHIKNGLSIICHGPHLNNPDTARKYPFHKTIKGFKERFNNKTPEMQKGMLGELLAHFLINNYIDTLKVFSPYFNKEEANIRKGFDVLYVDTLSNCIRYGEVKSGEVHTNKTIDETNCKLLYNAEMDLAEKLQNSDRQVLWDNAKFDASLYPTMNNNIDLHTLLNDDEDTHLSNDKKAILVSVCFHDINDKIEIEKIKEFYKRHEGRQVFLDTIIFSIQKNTLEKVQRFMLEECD